MMGLYPWTVMYTQEGDICVKDVFGILEIPEGVKYLKFKQPEDSALPVISWEEEETELRLFSATRGHFARTSKTFGGLSNG
jgi:hypothetical protein